jgi:hypothetical protein
VRVHGAPLAVVLAAAAIAQWVVLSQQPAVFATIDTPSYVSPALAILQHGQYVDAYRTPGYPGFLALVWRLSGTPSDLHPVLVAQTLMASLMGAPAYAIAFGILRQRWLAAASAIVVAANIYLVNWERAAMTESLSIFLTLLLFAALARWLVTRSPAWAGLFAIIAVTAILTRPALLAFVATALFVAAVSARRIREFALVAATASFVALPVAGYGALNAREHPGAGLTWVNNVNLLGKVLEFQLQDGADAGRYGRIRAMADAAVASGDVDPYRFGISHPGLVGRYYERAEAFSLDAAVHEPEVFIAGAVQDTVRTWLEKPALWAEDQTHLRMRLAKVASGAAYKLYRILPVVMLGAVIWWVRRRTDGRAALVAAVALGAGAELTLTGAGAYIDFARLRVAADPLAMLGAASAIGLVAQGLYVRVRPTATADVREHATGKESSSRLTST